jgi:hypothetical protein
MLPLCSLVPNVHRSSLSFIVQVVPAVRCPHRSPAASPVRLSSPLFVIPCVRCPCCLAFFHWCSLVFVHWCSLAFVHWRSLAFVCWRGHLSSWFHRRQHLHLPLRAVARRWGGGAVMWRPWCCCCCCCCLGIKPVATLRAEARSGDVGDWRGAARAQVR